MEKIMNLCFNRLWDEFNLSKNVVDLIPVEEDETQGGILCFLDSGTFFMESNQETRRWSSVFDLEKTLQSGWEIFCLCWIENCSVGKLQPIPDKFSYSTSSLPTSINPSFIPSVDGQNREEKSQTILKPAFHLVSWKMCLLEVFFQGKKKKKEQIM